MELRVEITGGAKIGVGSVRVKSIKKDPVPVMNTTIPANPTPTVNKTIPFANNSFPSVNDSSPIVDGS